MNVSQAIELASSLFIPEFLFADGVVVSIEDNKLRGVAVGETYIQKLKATSKQIVSYKVVVEG